MPQYNYAQEQVSPFVSGMRTIGSALASMPALRARAAAMQQMAAERQAMQQEAMARTGLIGSQQKFTDARTADLVRKGQLVEALQKIAPQAMRAMASGNLDDPSVDEFTGATAALTGQNKGDIQESMKKGLGTFLALKGNVPLAAAVQNPVSVNNNQVNADERANRPMANPAGTPNQIAEAIQKIVPDSIKSVQDSSPIPINPSTETQNGTGGKPFELTMAQALQSKLKNTAAQLAQAGDPQAEFHAQQLVMGTNATAIPNIVTNRAAIPATGNHFWNSAAVPADISTNSFQVQAGGADQNLVSSLMQNPKLASIVQNLGVVPQTNTATNSPDVNSAMSQLPDFGTSITNQPQSKILDIQTAKSYLQKAGGNKALARQMAVKDGYSLTSQPAQ